ncbi:Hypothetical predicted protein [Podarcis lilfordi]|uniref:Uncharacterized protein n=1 Tax=Podarcis lilfordi TaxID=74358 RepID=A0AA35KYB8_9SAUR|nr:Hypothetical predicted protein [Podarcis lilfordi]
MPTPPPPPPRSRFLFAALPGAAGGPPRAPSLPGAGESRHPASQHGCSPGVRSSPPLPRYFLCCAAVRLRMLLGRLRSPNGERARRRQQQERALPSASSRADRSQRDS